MSDAYLAGWISVFFTGFLVGFMLHAIGGWIYENGVDDGLKKKSKKDKNGE